MTPFVGCNPARRAEANRAFNLMTDGPMRRYGFAYMAWMENGCVGIEPEHPRVSRAGAAQVRALVATFDLWSQP